MTSELYAELHRIQRRICGLPEPLQRLYELERLLCGPLTIEDRRKYRAEFMALTDFPQDERTAA